MKTIEIKQIKEKVVKQFNRLEKRQRTLVLLLIAAILFSVYYNMVFKPQSSALQKVTIEFQNINNKITRLKSQLPNLQKERKALSAARELLDNLKARLSTLESELPTLSNIPELLGELVNQASGYYVDFISIKPKTGEYKKEYAELSIEMIFNSYYQDFTNYLNRLESLFEFLKATDIVIEEMKEGLNSRSKVTLTVATILGEGKRPQDIREKKIASPIVMERNPFASLFKPKTEKVEEEELKLSGIIATGEQPTAIINDEVYQVGDTIDNKTIKEITHNMVILSDRKASIVLTMEEE